MLPGKSSRHADLTAGGGSKRHDSDLGPDITGGLGAGLAHPTFGTGADERPAGVALSSETV